MDKTKKIVFSINELQGMINQIKKGRLNPKNEGITTGVFKLETKDNFLFNYHGEKLY